MTEDMEMIFIFHPANSEKNSNFTYASSDFVWKYELHMKTDDENNDTLIHGYFNLRAGQKTHLDLSAKYEKENMRWIRFICFETCSPQQRAWFIPIKGLAFGEPRALMQRNEVSFKKVIVNIYNKQAWYLVVFKIIFEVQFYNDAMQILCNQIASQIFHVIIDIFLYPDMQSATFYPTIKNNFYRYILLLNLYILL